MPMRRIIEGPPAPDEAKPPLVRRLLWFAAIWIASLMATATVAYALRALIVPAHH
jgi:hypothetical protein